MSNSPSKRETLTEFVRHVDEFRARLYLQQGLQQFSFQIATDPKTGTISSSVEEGDPEQLRSFILAFRKLTASDPGNFRQAIKVALRCLSNQHTEFRSDLKKIRTEWNHTWNKGFIRMEERGMSLTPAFCFDLWLNGEFFHSDKEKRILLEELKKSEVPSVKIQFFWSLGVLVGLSRVAADLISAGLAQDAFLLEED